MNIVVRLRRLPEVVVLEDEIVGSPEHGRQRVLGQLVGVRHPERRLDGPALVGVDAENVAAARHDVGPRIAVGADVVHLPVVVLHVVPVGNRGGHEGCELPLGPVVEADRAVEVLMIGPPVVDRDRLGLDELPPRREAAAPEREHEGVIGAHRLEGVGLDQQVKDGRRQREGLGRLDALALGHEEVGEVRLIDVVGPADGGDRCAPARGRASDDLLQHGRIRILVGNSAEVGGLDRWGAAPHLWHPGRQIVVRRQELRDARTASAAGGAVA